MFPQGTLLFVSDFDFSTIDGSLSRLNNFRDKYILVLDNYGSDSSILCCFTTTLSKEKEFHEVAEIGCNKDFFKYHVFHFQPFTRVTDKDHMFPARTFIAGNKGQIFGFPLQKLIEQYDLKDKIMYRGVLYRQLLFDVLYCLNTSKTLEKDQREELFDIGNEIYKQIQADEAQESEAAEE